MIKLVSKSSTRSSRIEGQDNRDVNELGWPRGQSGYAELIREANRFASNKAPGDGVTREFETECTNAIDVQVI